MTNSSFYQCPDFERRRRQRLRKAARRDLIFILAGAIACALVAYVETHASDANGRLNNVVIQETTVLSEEEDVVSSAEKNADDSCMRIHRPHLRPPPNNDRRIIDAGFILTKPMHSYLARHRDVNDVLALANSILLGGPLAYVVYVTLWKGDFRLAFRLIATHLFRSLCGWFT